LPAYNSSKDGETSVDSHNKHKSCVKIGVHGGDVIDPNVNSRQQVTATEQAQMIQGIQETFCDEVAKPTDSVESLHPFDLATFITSPIESKPLHVHHDQRRSFHDWSAKGNDECLCRGWIK
jgi:hypothetical protein